MKRITRLPVLFRTKSFWIIFPLVTFFYWVLTQRFQSLDLFSSEQLWIRFNALLLKSAETKALGVLDFRIPPLNLLLHIIFIGDRHMVFFPILSGFLVSFLILYGITSIQTKTLKFLCSLYLIFSPSILFSCLFVPDYVLFLILFCLAFYFLLEFSVSEQTFYLFIFGLLFALIALLRFESFWMSLPVFLLLFLRYRKHGLFFYYAIAALFPVFFLLLSWLFLAFIFKGDWMGVLHKIWVEPLFALTMFSNPLERFLIQTTWPFFLLYGVTVLRLGRYRSFYRSALFFVLLVPFFTPFFIRAAPQDIRPGTFASMFFIHYLVLFPYIGGLFNEKKQKVFYNLFIVGYFVFNVFSFAISAEPHEALFFKGITERNYLLPESKEMEIAHMIENRTLLSDTQSCYEVLQFLPDLSHLVYPGQPEYESVLFSPTVFVEYILMNKSGDRVYKQYKKRPFSDFRILHEDERYLLLERIADT